MRAIISILALFVISGWAVVYFKYDQGGFFHLTLATAVVSIIYQWIPGSKR